MLQPECVEQAAGRHLIIADDGNRAQQRDVFLGQRLSEKQFTQPRRQRDKHSGCRYADQPDRGHRAADQPLYPFSAADCLRSRDGG